MYNVAIVLRFPSTLYYSQLLAHICGRDAVLCPLQNISSSLFSFPCQTPPVTLLLSSKKFAMGFFSAPTQQYACNSCQQQKCISCLLHTTEYLQQLSTWLYKCISCILVLHTTAYLQQLYTLLYKFISCILHTTAVLQQLSNWLYKNELVAIIFLVAYPLQQLPILFTSPAAYPYNSYLSCSLPLQQLPLLVPTLATIMYIHMYIA